MPDAPAPAPRSFRTTWTGALTTIRQQWSRTGRDLRRKVTWGRLYRATSYARSALWIVPFVAILLVMIFMPIIRAVDAAVDGNVFGL